MSQEEKQILLKDLSARLPYGVKVRISSEGNGHLHQNTNTLDIDNLHLYMLDGGYYMRGNIYKIPCFQLFPYLRPMSDMTEKEKKEFDDFCVIDEAAWKGNTEVGYKNQAIIMSSGIDWLLAHYFDFRGLIEKGLALEAPDGMYKTK